MQGMNPPHLVLLCPFAKANWHESPLAVHTSDLNNTSVQHWIGTILLKYEGMDQDMHYHQGQNGPLALSLEIIGSETLFRK